MLKMPHCTAIVLLSLSSGLFLTSCRDDTNDTMEEVGEDIDEAVEEVADEIDDAIDD